MVYGFGVRPWLWWWGKTKAGFRVGGIKVGCRVGLKARASARYKLFEVRSVAWTIVPYRIEANRWASPRVRVG